MRGFLDRALGARRSSAAAAQPAVLNLLPGSGDPEDGSKQQVLIRGDFVTCTQWPHGYIGKRNIELALNAFHRRHPDVSLLMDVTRHPYSFRGDSKGRAIPEGQESTWHEGLLGYVGGDPALRDAAEAQMRELGERAGIHLDYNVQTNWQPVDSQRAMLWARQFGKAENYMSALARKHFEERSSASHRATILAAAEEAGLDRQALQAFLETDELKDYVWRSYGSTIKEKGIHAIPYFVFNSPLSDGGPFRSGKGRPVIINGSGDQEQFLEVFEHLFAQVQRAGNL